MAGMGIQDRDYYVDKLREIQGHQESAKFRRSLGHPQAWAENAEKQPVSAGFAVLLVLAAVAALLFVARVLLKG